MDVKAVPTMSMNPTANAVSERMQQPVDNMLQIILHSNPLQNFGEANELIDGALATAQHAM